MVPREADLMVTRAASEVFVANTLLPGLTFCGEGSWDLQKSHEHWVGHAMLADGLGCSANQLCKCLADPAN